MTTLGTTAPTPVRGATGRVFLLAGRAAGYVGKLWRAAQNRRSVKQLLAWDARMLDDIGLTPGDVVAALDGSIGDDPTDLLVERRSQRRRLVLAGRPRRTRPKLLEI